MEKYINKYRYKVFWSEADESYLSCCEEIDNFHCHGNTPEEALSRFKELLIFHLEGMEEKDYPIPMKERVL